MGQRNAAALPRNSGGCGGILVFNSWLPVGAYGNGSQRRFATHFLRAYAGNPPSQSSGTLRALPEGAASPHYTGPGILTRMRRVPLPSQPAHPHDRTRRKSLRHPAQQNELARLVIALILAQLKYPYFNHGIPELDHILHDAFKP